MQGGLEGKSSYFAETGSGQWKIFFCRHQSCCPNFVSLKNIFVGTLVGADRFVKAINNLWIL
jgi:hypothetical protein